jgi:hypothetical protein
VGELSAIIGMLSAMDWNDCPQSIGIPVRNRRNPQALARVRNRVPHPNERFVAGFHLREEARLEVILAESFDRIVHNGLWVTSRFGRPFARFRVISAVQMVEHADEIDKKASELMKEVLAIFLQVRNVR